MQNKVTSPYNLITILRNKITDNAWENNCCYFNSKREPAIYNSPKYLISKLLYLDSSNNCLRKAHIYLNAFLWQRGASASTCNNTTLTINTSLIPLKHTSAALQMSCVNTLLSRIERTTP